MTIPEDNMLIATQVVPSVLVFSSVLALRSHTVVQHRC